MQWRTMQRMRWHAGTWMLEFNAGMRSPIAWRMPVLWFGWRLAAGELERL